MNFFNVTLKNGMISDGQSLNLRIPEGKNKILVEKGYEGKQLVFGIRPEDIHSQQSTLLRQRFRKCHHTSLICSYHALFSDLPPRQSHLTNIHFYSLFVSPKNRQSADCLFLGFVVFPTKRLVTNEKPEAV